jgi:hypothetical protein
MNGDKLNAMSQPNAKLPEIPEAEQTPLVQALLETILKQQEQIEALEAEIKRLKELKGKPKLKPSRMDAESGQQGKDETGKKPKPGPKRAKTGDLKIHEEKKIAPEGLPVDARKNGWRFKGYDDFVVQELKIETHTVRYRLETWIGPDGQSLKGQLPISVQGHYGAQLKRYVLYQYHHQRVTQPLLLEHLHDLGIEMSAGQLSRLLTERHEDFHDEKAGVLEAGLQVSSYLQTDDTGARHDGRNGYCTFIGNEWFAWFESTQSKSRVNFLSLLRAEHKDYVLNAGALEYMARHKLPRKALGRLEEGNSFANKEDWEAYLQRIGLTGPRHRQIATEGALMGSLLAHGFPTTMGIVSDDAGQFNVFRHALGWIHAERTINKRVPLNPTHAKHIDWVRCQMWDMYADLKAYKTEEALQTPQFREEIRGRFEELCRTRTEYQTLNGHLKRLARNQEELLRVLDDPALPLHNNLSENDIRDYVSRRKTSGSTRSEDGRRCRDTFTSLKKTCRKLGISFWHYLHDRVARVNTIPPLAEAIRAVAAGGK